MKIGADGRAEDAPTHAILSLLLPAIAPMGLWLLRATAVAAPHSHSLDENTVRS